MTLDSWDIVFSLILEYKKEIWIAFLSRSSPSQLHSPVLL